ncbi:MAG: hypothetical protein R3224_03795 [Balneolaceae bacterium]|nr:hypothetical protein [Balneolaceae bacterium]
MQEFLKLLGIIFVIGLSLLWSYTYFQGKKIVAFMKRRYPSKWENKGRPTPNYLNTLQHQKWMAFLSQKEYLKFNDTVLDEMCEEQRTLEKLTLILTIAFFLLFGGIAVWYEYGS